MLKLHLKYTSEAARRSVAASTAKSIEKVLIDHLIDHSKLTRISPYQIATRAMSMAG
jgi:hypothetical protein